MCDKGTWCWLLGNAIVYNNSCYPGTLCTNTLKSQTYHKNIMQKDSIHLLLIHLDIYIHISKHLFFYQSIILLRINALISDYTSKFSIPMRIALITEHSTVFIWCRAMGIDCAMSIWWDVKIIWEACIQFYHCNNLLTLLSIRGWVSTQ
jgi:hypothetical protein